MPLTTEEKKTLLKAARDAIMEKLPGSPSAAPGHVPADGPLSEDSGAFVTLHKYGHLRGCIGNFISDSPLYTNVKEMAASAAFMDPRFSPVEAGELKDIDIEISVISPLKEITDISEIEVGRHGLYITDGRARGVLLPQVAVEQGFDRETFLEHTCIKAGLEPNCWKKGARIFIFEAEVFGES